MNGRARELQRMAAIAYFGCRLTAPALAMGTFGLHVARTGAR